MRTYDIISAKPCNSSAFGKYSIIVITVLIPLTMLFRVRVRVRVKVIKYIREWIYLHMTDSYYRGCLYFVFFPVATLCKEAQVDIIELEPGNWLAKAINGRLINKALSRGVSFEVSD